MTENVISISIVMALDNNYVLPTQVAVISMLKNKKENSYYKYFFLVSDDFSENNRQSLKKVIKDYKNVSMDVICVSKDIFKNAHITTPHLTVASFYRLVISDVLDGYEKCIYLDGDVIVSIDLQELWKTDIQDEYIGGVKNWNFQQKNTFTERHRKELGLESLKQYINAGILLMNLRKMKQENITEKFYKHIDKGYSSEDQDILNVCCYNKIYFLPLRYNIYSRYLGKLDQLRGDIYTDAELEEARTKPAIIHFADIIKPWKNIRCVYGKEWWDYAAKVLSKKEYKDVFEDTCRRTKMQEPENLLNRCRNSQNIIIFGFTQLGKELCKKLKELGINQIKYFSDNDVDKWNMEYKGIKVKRMDDILKELDNVFIINVCQRAFREVNSQLLKKGIFSEQIFSFNIQTFLRNINYYTSIESEYYPQEVRQIYLLEGGRTEDFNYQEYLEKAKNDIEIRKKYGLDFWLFYSGK